MNQETTDNIIVYAIETRKVDNNKICKALFVTTYALLRTRSECAVLFIVQW